MAKGHIISALSLQVHTAQWFCSAEVNKINHPVCSAIIPETESKEVKHTEQPIPSPSRTPVGLCCRQRKGKGKKWSLLPARSHYRCPPPYFSADKCAPAVSTDSALCHTWMSPPLSARHQRGQCRKGIGPDLQRAWQVVGHWQDVFWPKPYPNFIRICLQYLNELWLDLSAIFTGRSWTIVDAQTLRIGLSPAFQRHHNNMYIIYNNI
jgi:hypothetical protein